MELFSEIYGCYYTVLARLLERAHPAGLDRTEVEAIVRQSGFADTAFQLLPKLVSGEWPLLNERNGRFYASLASNAVRRPLSDLEKAWLKALLEDPRLRLFLDDAQIAALHAALSGTTPLFQADDFHIYDVAADGDPYTDSGYRARFALILRAIQQKAPLRILYEGGKGRRTSGVYFPWRLNYSAKDDKFRLLAATCFPTRKRRVIMNVARMLEIENLSSALLIDVDYGDRLFQQPVENPSILLRIYPERNALERAMLQFAAYQKETEYDEPSGSYLCRIYFDPEDETELLIRVLSFGPTIKALEPTSFVAQLRERIQRQVTLNEQIFSPAKDVTVEKPSPSSGSYYVSSEG